MPLTNAEKQQRWRDRNVIVLTATAREIAEKLIEMEDQPKLRKVARFINDHLKNPNRTPHERAVAVGRIQLHGLNGPLSPKAAFAALSAPKHNHSWRIEASTQDGKRWQNGVRLETKEQAEVYIEAHVRYDLEKQGYVTAKIVRCDDEANCSVIRNSRKGRPTLVFPDGQCTMLGWGDVTVTA